MQFFIDFENVRSDGFEGADRLDHGDSVTLFYSDAAFTAKQESLEQLCNSGCKVGLCKLVNQGKNALDFYIATSLGEAMGRGYMGDVAIISGDKGFQALVDYWKPHLSENKHKIVIGKNIAIALSLCGGERASLINASRKTINLADFINNYQHVNSMEYKVNEALQGNAPKTEIVQIGKYVESAISFRELYLLLIKNFGKIKGTDIYHKVKPLVA